jgi:transposase
VDDGSDDATCLLGLDGLAVERVVLTAAGVRIVQLVTGDADAARCPACRVVSSSGKGWVLTRPRDVPSGGGSVWLQWRKRRWRCRTQECPQQTFTESVEQVPAGMRTTSRLREMLAVAVADGRDQSEVAAAHGVSWPTVQRALVAYAARELAEPEPTTVLGLDETRFGRVRWLPDGVHEDGRVGGGAPIRGRPGSSTWPMIRRCWGRSMGVRRPRCGRGWPSAARSSAIRSRRW